MGNQLVRPHAYGYQPLLDDFEDDALRSSSQGSGAITATTTTTSSSEVNRIRHHFSKGGSRLRKLPKLLLPKRLSSCFVALPSQLGLWRQYIPDPALSMQGGLSVPSSGDTEEISSMVCLGDEGTVGTMQGARPSSHATPGDSSSNADDSGSVGTATTCSSITLSTINSSNSISSISVSVSLGHKTTSLSSIFAVDEEHEDREPSPRLSSPAGRLCEAQRKYRTGIELWKKGKYGQSMHAFGRAAELYKGEQRRGRLGRDDRTSEGAAMALKFELAKVYACMGKVQSSLGQHGKGEKLCRNALDSLEYHLDGNGDMTVLGVALGEIAHRQIWLLLANVFLVMSQNLDALGQYAMTIKYIHRAMLLQQGSDMCVCKQEFVDVVVDYAASLMTFGLVSEKAGDLSFALGCYEEAYKVYQRRTEPPSPSPSSSSSSYAADLAVDRATALANTGWVQYQLGNVEEALVAYNEALELQTQAVGGKHRNVASVLTQMGAAYIKLGRLTESLSSFKRALSIQRYCLGDFHEDVAATYSMIGSVCAELKDWPMAKVGAYHALEIRARILGSDHLVVASDAFQLGNILVSAGEPGAAAEYYENVVRAYRSNGIPMTDSRAVEAQELLLSTGRRNNRRSVERFVLTRFKSLRHKRADSN